MKNPLYRRILLKLSGEALAGSREAGIAAKVCEEIAISIGEILHLGIQVAIVIGGGNIFRGIQGKEQGLSRTAGDQMGMLGTLINGIALKQAIEKKGFSCRILSAVPCESIVETHTVEKARNSLIKGETIVFVGGTGNPFFTTDSAAALRALEIEADVLLKATKVDGIYTADPFLSPEAKKFDRLGYSEILAKNLQVMDAVAIALCREHRLPIRVLNMLDRSLIQAMHNEAVGTLVVGE